MAVKFTNDATSLLASSISADDTTLGVTSADATKFPVLGEGDWCPITVVDAGGNMEVMKCTARSGSTLTVARGQEGTTALAFDAGARVDVRLTAAAIADIFAAIALKAPLSSPEFTDTPKVPTAADGTNTTQAASTAYVVAAIAAAIADLVDTAPGTLDTLNELAAALGDDPNFATTITNLIATKQDKDSFTTSSDDPSGGADGDIWFQIDA